jgi:hypothetical protein
MHQSAKSSHDTLLSTGMTRFIAFEPSFCCTGQGEFLFAIFRGVCAGRPERSNGVLPVWEVAPERGKPCSQTLFFYPHFPSVEKKNRDLLSLVDEGTLKIGPYNDGKNDDEAHCVLSWPLPAQESMREEIRKAFKESLKKVLDSKNP